MSTVSDPSAVGSVPAAPAASPPPARPPHRRLGGGSALLPLGVLMGIALLDQATQSAFNILVPNIRDAFHLSNTGIESIVAAAGASALLCTVPVAWLADRQRRVPIALVGAAVGAAFSLALGLAPTTVVMAVMLCGVYMGQAVIFPTHNSLLADYYPVLARPGVYSSHRASVSLGAVVGVLGGAGLEAAFSWRAPFVVAAVPIAVVVLVGLRLREPARGRHELVMLAEGPPGALAVTEDEGPVVAPMATAALAAAVPPGALPGPGTAPSGTGDEAAEATEAAEPPPSFGECWRMVWKIAVLRRIFFALPFLAAAIIGFTSLAALQYQQTFHLDAVERAYLVAPVQVFVLGALVVGAKIATGLAERGFRFVFRLLAVAAVAAAAFTVVFALAPSVPVAFFADAGIEASLAIVGPGVLASLSLAIPARARSIGFSIGAIFVLPGLLALPLVTAVGDEVGFRYGMLMLVPVFLVGGLVVASAGGLIEGDVHNVWTSMAARAGMLADRRKGLLPLVWVRGLQVGYDGVPVVRGVDLEIGEGEIVALLGTNGAGKSTLLRAIGGVTEADGGAVVFDGRDITHMPPDEIARLGIAQVPGGEGVFPNLTVEENLRAGAWPQRRRRREVEHLVAGALERFEVLAQRRHSRAGDLSGGQQQVLALAMSLLARPKLLLVDELSLGLAPLVVERLMESLRSLRAEGTAVLLVEQSANVAVGLADRVYVMDNGTIRFTGPASALRDRPDLLWSIYVEHAAAGLPAVAPDGDGPGPGGPAAPGAPTAAPLAAAPLAATPGGRGPAGPGSALGVHDVTVSFGGIAALSGVSFEVPDGQTLGVIGPNGAGKTTLFDVVSGFTRPRVGRVLLHGRDVTAQTPAARAREGLGRSFQDSRLFAELTVRETLAVSLDRFVDVVDPLNAMLRLPAQQRTEAAVEQRVEELLELFGLGRFAERFIRELSTGTRRLVDLAAVMAHRPSVVLLDEPTSGIAQREVEAMGDLLGRVQAELGATVVVVEHDIAFVRELADHLVALDQGSVLAAGPPDEVLARREVEDAFLGADPLARARSGRLAAPSARPGEGAGADRRPGGGEGR